MKAIKNWQRYVLEWGILAALIVFILVSHVIGGGDESIRIHIVRSEAFRPLPILFLMVPCLVT